MDQDLTTPRLRPRPHRADDGARVQEKCGFRITGRGRLACRSRGGEVEAAFAELRPGGHS